MTPELELDPRCHDGPGARHRRDMFHRVTGLAGRGRHETVMRWAFRELCPICETCQGFGYHLLEDDWRWCASCKGFGRIMTREARRILLGRIGRAFPEAVLESGRRYR